MSKLNSLPDRALELVSVVGDNLKQVVPQAGKWLETGAKLGALKTGARVAGAFVRRNPVVAVAAVAGAGLLWYAARQRARKAQADEPIEGTSRRIEARRTEGNGSTRRRTATRKPPETPAADESATTAE